MNRAGYVLVGGRSSRMGHDKALLPYRGGALVESVAKSVAQAAGDAVLIGSPALYGGFGFPVIADGWPGEGPLGGVLTVLKSTIAEWNLVVACDMPGLSAAFLGRLLDAAEQSGGDLLAPYGPSGRIEPLCAVYHRGCYDAMHSAFARGIRKVTESFEHLRVTAWPVPELTPFQNVNTPEDWAAYVAE